MLFINCQILFYSELDNNTLKYNDMFMQMLEENEVNKKKALIYVV